MAIKRTWPRFYAKKLVCETSVKSIKAFKSQSLSESYSHSNKNYIRKRISLIHPTTVSWVNAMYVRVINCSVTFSLSTVDDRSRDSNSYHWERGKSYGLTTPLVDLISRLALPKTFNRSRFHKTTHESSECSVMYCLPLVLQVFRSI